jgi:hypothetical protein
MKTLKILLFLFAPLLLSAQNGVIGTAVFSASGATISNGHYTGVVASVTYVSTGVYQVNFSTAQQYIGYAASVPSDSSSARMSYTNGTPNFNSSISNFQTSFVQFTNGGAGGTLSISPVDPAGTMTITVFRAGP